MTKGSDVVDVDGVLPTVHDFFFDSDSRGRVDSWNQDRFFGGDGITTDIVRLSCPEAIPFVMLFINIGLSTDEFSNAWKQASVRHTTKTAHPRSLGDLRPISTLPILLKILYFNPH